MYRNFSYVGSFWAVKLIGILIMVSTCSSEDSSSEIPVPVGYTLVWNDEFDYNGLPDSEKWGYDVGNHGWGNQELQNYVEKSKETAYVADGKLTITAFKLQRGTASEILSARLVTRDKGDWLYGRFDIRAKIPSGKGTWPAIWMLPTDWEYGNWPRSGEIDIMEHVGYDEGNIHGSIHTQSFNHSIGTQKSGSIFLPTAVSAFHIYSIVWEPQRILFLVDDELYFTFNNSGKGSAEWPFDKRFHLILNIAFGGTWGGAQGIDESVLPQTMEVDYVRVFQKKE